MKRSRLTPQHPGLTEPKVHCISLDTIHRIASSQVTKSALNQSLKNTINGTKSAETEAGIGTEQKSFCPVVCCPARQQFILNSMFGVYVVPSLAELGRKDRLDKITSGPRGLLTCGLFCRKTNILVRQFLSLSLMTVIKIVVPGYLFFYVRCALLY